MGRKLRYTMGIVVLVIAAVGCVSIFYRLLSLSGGTQSSSNESSTPSSSLEAIQFLSETQYFKSGIVPIISTSTGATVSFQNFVAEDRGGGYSADVYVNNKNIGRVGGLAFSQPIFSPDGKKLAARFIDYAGGAGSIEDSYLTVIDLANGTSSMINLASFRGAGKYRYQGDAGQFAEVGPYMESFTWNDNSSLDVVIYFVGSTYNVQDKTISYHRISSKQVWRYDLASKQYTLL